jgi:YD repeat-containing protein
MKQLSLLTLVLIFSSSSWALVNMRNGSYVQDWVDFIEPSPGIEMKIQRTYSSRSLFIGLFGYGWCTALETHLKITSDGIINLVECGGGLEMTFYPNDFDVKSPEDTIQRIVEDYKSKKKLSASDIVNFKAQVRANTKMRFEYANKLGLVDLNKIKKSKNIFLAKAKGTERINFTGEYYERLQLNNTVERFNKKGQLIQITQASGQKIKINYKGPRISFITDNKGRRLTFTYGSDGSLAKITNGKGLSVQYRFEGENLIQVTNMWSKTYTYNYDNNHNMTGVQFPDKTQLKMVYDRGKDWIVSYVNRKGCRETYDFILDSKDPQNHYTGAFTRQCPGQKKYSGRHKFWYKNYSFSQDKYLSRVYEEYERVATRSDYKDSYFHPYFGRPTSIRENSLYQGFSYFPNGLVNKSERKIYTAANEVFRWSKNAFQYNPKALGQITEVTQRVLNALGKITESKKYRYQYNKKGLLTKAMDSKGYTTLVFYDDEGRISRLKNNKSEEIKLTYKVGIVKPVSIEQPNVGLVTITYDDAGEVANVESKGARGLATSIVEKFISMASALGPAGSNLKI